MISTEELMLHVDVVNFQSSAYVRPGSIGTSKSFKILENSELEMSNCTVHYSKQNQFYLDKSIEINFNLTLTREDTQNLLLVIYVHMMQWDFG